MGISTNFYTICGVKLDWNTEFADAYDEVYDDADTPFVLLDSMGGEYIIPGVVIFDSGDERYGFEDGDQFKEIDLEAMKDAELEYKREFIAKFPQFIDLINQPFKVMSLVHIS